MSEFRPPPFAGPPGRSLDVEPVDATFRELAAVLNRLDARNLAPGVKLSIASADGAVPNAIDYTHHILMQSAMHPSVASGVALPVFVTPPGGPWELIHVSAAVPSTVASATMAVRVGGITVGSAEVKWFSTFFGSRWRKVLSASLSPADVVSVSFNSDIAAVVNVTATLRGPHQG